MWVGKIEWRSEVVRVGLRRSGSKVLPFDDRADNTGLWTLQLLLVFGGSVLREIFGVQVIKRFFWTIIFGVVAITRSPKRDHHHSYTYMELLLCNHRNRSEQHREYLSEIRVPELPSPGEFSTHPRSPPSLVVGPWIKHQSAQERRAQLP